MKPGSRAEGTLISAWICYCQCRLNSIEQSTSILFMYYVFMYYLCYFVRCCCILFCSFLSSICVALWSLNYRRFSNKPCLKRPLKGECRWTLTIKSRMSGRIIGSVTGSREMKRRMWRDMIGCGSP